MLIAEGVAMELENSIVTYWRNRQRTPR